MFAWSMEVKDKDGKLLVSAGSPMAVNFDIKRDTSRKPNTAIITVFNFKSSTRALMQKYPPIDSYNFDLAFAEGYVKNYGLDDYRSIVLKAIRDGYESVIFAGTIISCYSSRDGGEWQTEFECGDGFFASRFSTMDTTIESNFAATKAIETEAKKWKLAVDITGEPRTSNKSVSIQSLEEMADFAFPNNWYIDCETLKAFGKNSDFSKKVYKLSGNLHINSSPKRMKNILNVGTVFMPELRLGHIVEIRSELMKDNNGQWEIAAISHSGELGIGTTGDCKTDLVCIPPKTRWGSE